MSRLLIFLALAAFSATAIAASLKPEVKSLLGEKRCTWGPSYWCSNITNAAGCHAVKHCIQTVWEQKELPPDSDSVCQTCIKMVKEARDQLESNETQEEIKEVFEGSCKLIPVRVINTECCKLADEFIPELIDTLASQMNPQVVCSVAGLCNNERVDQLLAEHEQSTAVEPRGEKSTDTCQGCHTVVGIMEEKFNKMSRDNVLQSLLKVCGHLGTFSDACSNVVITYFTEIYKHLQENFNPTEVCLMAGECSAQFHVHANVQITPLSHIGYVDVDSNKDDLPCDLCQQLVGHLRDLLVANTTEMEFKQVLEGLCRQTGKFSNECLGLVGQYYSPIYSFLVNELNTSAVCMMIGICPSSENNVISIMPLIPSETAEKILLNPEYKQPTVEILQAPEQMQLPIERLTPSLGDLFNKQVCVFCEYFLHYLQQAITNPTAMDEIKNEVDKACDKLPSSINDTCVQFVNTYGDAVVALLAQEIDPSTVCPLVRACPGKQLHDVEIFMEAKPEKPNCPLCLFAVTKLEEEITDKKSKESIKLALTKLCDHLSGAVRTECDDFVHTYTDELVEMLIADLNPQEVCVYLKLCTDKKPAPTLPPLRTFITTTSAPIHKVELSNEIFDNTANGKNIAEIENTPQCVICEFAMDQLQHLLENKTTDDDIKKAVHGLCNHLPNSVKPECDSFVNQYADMVIQLLTSALQPSEICAYLKLCDQKQTIEDKSNVNSLQCKLCKMVVKQLEKLIDGKIDKASIENGLHRVCNALPQDMNGQCNDFVKKYGDEIIDLLSAAVEPEELCSLLLVCSNQFDLIKLEVEKCAVCEEAVVVIQKLLLNPRIDHSIEHILEKTCRALPTNNQNLCKEMVDIYGGKLFDLVAHINDTQLVCHEVNLCPNLPRNLGSDPCTWGPGHWCKSLENANKCNNIQFCQEKIWKAKAPLS